MFFKAFVLTLCAAYSSANIETWPFSIADKYVESFKEQLHDLKSTATKRYALHEDSYIADRFDEDEAIKSAHTYDFIIVGGGTSGAVLANRLSEIPEWKVLLLEAGHKPSDASLIPEKWELLKNTPYNWGYFTTPQNYSCLGMEDHRCFIPSAKVLGGHTTVNSMVYTRGNARDYDLWSDLGSKDWCYAHVLPYFKKIEDAHFEPFDKKYHHRGGPMHIQHPQHLTHLSKSVADAAREIGLNTVDYNGKSQIGLGIPQLITRFGRRHGTHQAYLEPAEKRDNLVVLPQSKAVKILFGGHTKEAQGVQYLHEGKLYLAKADKEVILAAGAINTPKLLLLSGIGPDEDLHKLHIETVADLQVGKKLSVRPTFTSIDFVYKEQHHDDAADEEKDIWEYLKHGKGPLSTPGIEAISYLKSAASKDPTPYPDIELQFFTKTHSHEDKYKYVKLADEYYKSYGVPLEGKRCINVAVTLNHPKSVGSLKLHDKDPLHDPIIEPNLLADEDEHDTEALLSGIEHVLRLAKGEAFHKLGASLNHNQVHGCEHYEVNSEAYWRCSLKYLVTTTGDVSGTARMGPESDKYAVVDHKLKVYGVYRLRIADASVIPVPITGNLMAASILIGEKAAEYIVQDWK